MRRAACVLIFALLAGCDDEPIQVGRGLGGPAENTTTENSGEVAAEIAPDAGIRVAQYRDQDFAEAETNRDPFRSQAQFFAPITQPTVRAIERDVKLPDTSIEQMRVIGIVTNIADPRAMLVDQNGMGHVVRRGNYVGRVELVQAGDSLTVPVNWRVERIRPNEVVLMRDDPTAPNRPPLTRILPLRDQQEQP